VLLGRLLGTRDGRVVVGDERAALEDRHADRGADRVRRVE
jgi:hypothetical protein